MASFFGAYENFIKKVIFEYDCANPTPMILHRNDCNLYVKFRFSDDCVPIVGDMLALYDADQLALNGGNLSNPKTVAMVPLDGYFAFQCITFQPKDMKNLHGKYVFHYIRNFPEKFSIGRSNFYEIRCPQRGGFGQSVCQPGGIANEISILTDRVLAEHHQTYLAWSESMKKTAIDVGQLVHNVVSKQLRNELIYERIESAKKDEKIRDLEFKLDEMKCQLDSYNQRQGYLASAWPKPPTVAAATAWPKPPTVAAATAWPKPPSVAAATAWPKPPTVVTAATAWPKPPTVAAATAWPQAPISLVPKVPGMFNVRYLPNYDNHEDDADDFSFDGEKIMEGLGLGLNNQNDSDVVDNASEDENNDAIQIEQNEEDEQNKEEETSENIQEEEEEVEIIYVERNEHDTGVSDADSSIYEDSHSFIANEEGDNYSDNENNNDSENDYAEGEENEFTDESDVDSEDSSDYYNNEDDEEEINPLYRPYRGRYASADRDFESEDFISEFGDDQDADHADNEEFGNAEFGNAEFVNEEFGNEEFGNEELANEESDSEESDNEESDGNDSDNADDEESDNDESDGEESDNEDSDGNDSDDDSDANESDDDEPDEEESGDGDVPQSDYPMPEKSKPNRVSIASMMFSGRIQYDEYPESEASEMKEPAVKRTKLSESFSLDTSYDDLNIPKKDDRELVQSNSEFEELMDKFWSLWRSGQRSATRY